MVLGLLAATVGLVLRPVGLFLAALSRIPLGYLIGLSERLARSPLPQITAPGGEIGSLALGLGATALGAWWLRGHRRPSRLAVVAVGLVLPLFVWTGALRAGPPRHLTVVFFSVGQGDSALVRSPGGGTILVDGGPDPELVATKLGSLGIRRIDLMVATHPHADHVAGLPAVLARFPVGLIIDPGCSGDSPFYAQFVRAVRASGVPFRHPRPGAVLSVADMRVEVLGPEHCFTGTNSDPNNDSLIFRLTDGPASVLFPGDAEEPTQGEILRDEPGFLQAVVLKVPHHGGDTSLHAFIDAIHARVAVVSVGPNHYGHPVPAVLAELAHDGMRVLRTDRAGDVTVTFEGGGVLIQSTRD
jgi:competence protein ComEC